MPKEIMFNGQMVEKRWFVEFKREWKRAEAAGHDQFKFYGQDVLCGYAKYVIQYAEAQFKEIL